MKALYFLLYVLSVFLWLPASTQTKADLIIINGKITTLDDEAGHTEALAISGNKILLAGDNSKVLDLKDKSTIIIDAKGRRVIPGLFDTHLHVIRGGRFYNAELRWDGVQTLKRALEMLKEQASRTPAGQWVRVIGAGMNTSLRKSDYPRWWKSMKRQEMCPLLFYTSTEKHG